MYHYTLSHRIFAGALLSSSLLFSVSSFAQEQSEADKNQPLDEIIVTGSPLSATSSGSLAGVSVLTKENLARRMSGSLGETLKSEPGISSSFFGPGASRPIIRGQGGLRVLLLDNGIGSIDASAASPDHAASVEPALAGRIEVIRGSGLLRYGSSASGGVINVIDGRIPEYVPDDKIDGAARISVSSVDDGYEGAAGADIALAKIGLGDLVGHLEIAHRKTEDYDIIGFARSARLRALAPLPPAQEIRNTLKNSATQATSTAVGLSYIGENSFFGAAIKDLNSEYGIPGGEGATIRLDQTREDFTSKFGFQGGFIESLNISGGYADYNHKEIEAGGDIGTVFTNKGFEMRSEVVQAKRGNWKAAHGVQFKKREFSAIGEEAFVPPTTTKQFGLFSFHQFELDALHLEASLRHENTRHDNKTAATKLEFNGLSGSLGADYHLTDTTKIGLSLYRTERAPTTEELFSNGPHLATNQFEIGDSNLGNERAVGTELSIRYRNGVDRITFNLFYTDYADYIYETFTGANMNLDGEALPVTQYTPANAVFKGFEVEARKDLGEIFGLDVALDGSLEYVDATIDIRGNNNLPRIPPFGAMLGLNLDAGAWSMRAEVEHATKQTNIAFGELPADAYSLVNAFVTYDINETLTLRLSALNLTDQEARQHTSFLQDLVPLPGRNIKTSLAVKF
ncbi:MAG: TonB-dependent receptor [Robiginitomaculum sp.]|nr:TonB-dependent receptor [Robiginitomaculum sp.]